MMSDADSRVVSFSSLNNTTIDLDKKRDLSSRPVCLWY